MSNTACSIFRIQHLQKVTKFVGLNHQSSVNREVINSFNLINYRFMAGHSKWQNIKHTKMEKDREKAFLCNKYSRLVRYAVKEQGPDPKLNRKLADVLAEARSFNVAFSTLEGAMKKSSLGGKVKSGLMEILGPGGCYVLVDYESEREGDTRYAVKVICKKYNAGIIAGQGRWRAFYEQKGILKVTRGKDGEALDAEKALEVAIEAGAEDVQLKTDEEQEAPFLEFYCDSNDLYSVKKVVEEQSYYVEEAYVGYIPNVTVQLSDEFMNAAGNFCSELREIPDVSRIYENVQ